MTMASISAYKALERDTKAARSSRSGMTKPWLWLGVTHHQGQTSSTTWGFFKNELFIEIEVTIYSDSQVVVVAYTFKPSTWAVEAGRSLSKSPAWSTE